MVALGHVIHRLQMQESRRADLGAIRLVGAIRHQIDAKLTLGRLNCGIDFARRHMEALGIELEMVDERLHRGFHLAALGRRDLAPCKHIALPLGRPQLFDRLVNDFQAFAHFLHPAQVAIIAIPVLTNRDHEVELIVAFVGLGAPQIPSQARAAHHHTREAPIQDLLLRDHADIAVALLENPVLREKALDIIEHIRERPRPMFDVVNQIGG